MCDLDGSDIGFDASDGLDFSSDLGSSEGFDFGSDIGSSEGLDLGSDIGSSEGFDLGSDIGTSEVLDLGSDIESFEPIESAPLEDAADIPFEPADDSVGFDVMDETSDLPFDEAAETFEETPLADTEELPFEPAEDPAVFNEMDETSDLPEEVLLPETEDLPFEDETPLEEAEDISFEPAEDPTVFDAMDETSDLPEEAPPVEAEEVPLEDISDMESFDPVDTEGSDNVNIPVIDDIMNSDMSNDEKREALENMRDNIQDYKDSMYSPETDQYEDDGAPVRVLKLGRGDTSISHPDYESELADLDEGIQNAKIPYDEAMNDILADNERIFNDESMSVDDKKAALEDSKDKLKAIDDAWKNDSGDLLNYRDELVEKVAAEHPETNGFDEIPADTAESDNVNYSPVDDIMNSDMSNAEKKDALQNLKEELQNDEPSDGTDWERTSLTPEQEEQVQDMIDNGELDVPEVNPDLKDPEHSALHLPADSGKFLGERGNSAFVPDNDEALNLMNDYGRDSVEYKDNYPDFSPFTNHETPWGPLDCQVEIPHMTDQRNNGTWEFGRRPAGTSHDPNYDIGNFAQADNALLEKFQKINPDATMDDVENFIKENNLTRHECPDGKTVQYIPKGIHDACDHSGGVSEMRYRQAWGDVELPY